MTEKLKDYQVIDVFCGGTFYKVRHKVTNKIFAWKAYDCSAYSDKHIQNVVNEVKTISEASSDCLLRYHDTVLHRPSKTLYCVLEYSPWRSLQALQQECEAAGRRLAEGLLWRVLHALARACQAVVDLRLAALARSLSADTVFVSDSGEIRADCFELAPLAPPSPPDLVRQLGELLRTLCRPAGPHGDVAFLYSDDLRDVIDFLTEDRSSALRPDVVLYHPTVLTHLETFSQPLQLSECLLTEKYCCSTSELNKCDSEKAEELKIAVEPLPRTIFNVGESPIYCNISPKRGPYSDMRDVSLGRESLSPTLAALALELPGYVPRSRKPYSEALESYDRPQLVTEQTFSQEWMSRLVALRQREESLNKRERDIIAKEIVNSPAAKVVPLDEALDLLCAGDSNGITLPELVSQAPPDRRWAARRRQRAGSTRARPRRKSYAYEDLDSSLSADAGDGSVIITATKFTADNMPRRNIFPEVSTKKVHFKSANPFTESDESVTLTFYELDNKDNDGYEVPRRNTQKDISKFKYLDTEKIATEKRGMVNWSHSSPSKQARITKNVFNDISNHSSIRKTPSKTSLLSRGSDSSRLSMMSARSHWSNDSSMSKLSEGGVFERTRSSIRQSLAQTPIAPDMKKKSRKSLITFKTPFKFMSSAK